MFCIVYYCVVGVGAYDSQICRFSSSYFRSICSAVLYIYALQYCTVMTFVCVCVCVCVNTYVMDTEHCLIGCFLLLIQAVKDILSVRHGQVAEAEGVL